MKIISAKIYCLNIPFVESFKHTLSERHHADSIVVKLTTDAGVSGFGEGVPRHYVTGETRSDCANHILQVLLPRLMGKSLDGISVDDALGSVSKLVPESSQDATVIWNAARCAVELALIDCTFRSLSRSVGAVLPPLFPTVTYSGVISSGPIEKVSALAQRCKAAGFKYIKMKVSGAHDAGRVGIVRNILGPAVSIRLDANAAFTPDTIIPFIQALEPYQIACIEQPIPRGSVTDLAAVRQASPIPIMADESIITMADAEALIQAKAVDAFNLRLSKCGGLQQTRAIAQVAMAAGIDIQIGCHVGETAILSAAGRHLAAALPGVRFVEGSYSTHLLEADISDQPIIFGKAGEAPVLSGPGLGIIVNEEPLNVYADEQISIG